MPNVDSLLNDFLGLISGNKPSEATPINKPSSIKKDDKSFEKQNTDYQNPIKGSYGNSGNFSPGIATDPRHKKGHNGVDLWAPGGTSVYPVNEGVVVSVSSGGKGGNTVMIQHPNGVKSYSAHLGTTNVHNGDKVTKNTIIGTVGDSGNAKGTFPHVHFQVWENGALKNPSAFINVPKYSLPQGVDEWVSEEAKQQAANFKYQPKQTVAMRIEQIEKLAEKYYLNALKL